MLVKNRKEFFEGLKDEDYVREKFNDTFLSRGGRCEKSDVLATDLYIFNRKNERFGVDVKGKHRISRNDNSKSDEYHWLELVNVQGNPGSIYHKETDFIAFITSENILFCRTKHLQRLAEDSIRGKAISEVNPKQCYIPYQRKGRKDLIVMVKNDDLVKLATKEYQGFIVE